MILYAEYTFYSGTYHGNMDENAFNRFIIPATAYVRRVTFGRADDNLGAEEVKLATCAVCDVYAAREKGLQKYDGKIVTSENTDGYSVSYMAEQAAGETGEELSNRKAYKAAEMFLGSTGLLCWEVEE